MTHKSTLLDEMFQGPLTTTILLYPRASDLEQLRSIVASNTPEKPALLEDLRQRIIKALKSINTQRPDGTYDAFMLGAHMAHVFALRGDIFDSMTEPTLGIGAAYFFQGFSGKPYRSIPKSKILSTPDLAEPVVIGMVRKPITRRVAIKSNTQVTHPKAARSSTKTALSATKIRRAQSRDEKRLFDAITA
jgi:hypothetical protein